VCLLTGNQAAKLKQQQTGQLVRWAIEQLGKLSQELATATSTTTTTTTTTATSATSTLLCNGLGRRHLLFMMYAYLCGIS